MINKTKVILLVLTSLVLTKSVSATTIFSRQYDMKCNACHIGVPPTLNATGENFLRNGMKFSSSDTTTLKRFLYDEDRVVPFSIFVGGVNKNVELSKRTKKGTTDVKKDIFNPMVTSFIAGSLSENLSTFIGARFIYVKNDPNSDDRELDINRRKIYLQYNSDTKHLLRAGVIYTYPETSQNSGLSDNLDMYISPLDRGLFKPLYGAEYSYLFDNGLMFLVAGGVVGELNDEESYIFETRYNGDNYRLSAIVNNIVETKDKNEIAKYKPSEITLGERLSIMLPFEYEFDHAYLNITTLYEKNERAANTEYYGFEGSLTIPVFETGNIRLIHTSDNDDAKGYSFRYAQIIYDTIFLNTNLAKVKTNNAEFESVSLGLNIIY